MDGKNNKENLLSMSSINRLASTTHADLGVSDSKGDACERRCEVLLLFAD